MLNWHWHLEKKKLIIRLLMALRQLKKQFEAAYGPLEQFGHSYSNYPWNWDDTPWPWQV